MGFRNGDSEDEGHAPGEPGGGAGWVLRVPWRCGPKPLPWTEEGSEMQEGAEPRPTLGQAAFAASVPPQLTVRRRGWGVGGFVRF